MSPRRLSPKNIVVFRSRRNLERLANEDLDAFGPGTYAASFHNRLVAEGTLRAVRDRLSAVSPRAPELAAIDTLLIRLAN